MFAHVQSRDRGYIGQRVLKIEQAGGKKGRQQLRFLDVVKDIQRVGVDKVRWRKMIHCGNSLKGIGRRRRRRSMVLIAI